MLLLIITLILSLLQKKPAEEEAENLELLIAEGIIEPDDLSVREIQEIDVEERSEIREQLERLIKSRPEAVASLLRNWLADDWE